MLDKLICFYYDISNWFTDLKFIHLRHDLSKEITKEVDKPITDMDTNKIDANVKIVLFINEILSVKS